MSNDSKWEFAESLAKRRPTLALLGAAGASEAPQGQPQSDGRRHRKSIFKKPVRSFRVLKVDEEIETPPRSPAPRAAKGELPHPLSTSSVTHPDRPPSTPQSPKKDTCDKICFENTRVTLTHDSQDLPEDDSVKLAKRYGLSPEFDKLIIFAEKFDVVFQMIIDAAKQECGTAKHNAVAFEILRVKFEELEKKESSFSAKLHKMLAVDASRYYMVKVGNFDCLGLEVRRTQAEQVLMSKDGKPLSYRKFFRRKLLGLVWDFHKKFLERTGLLFSSQQAYDWHPDFNLADVYGHLNYEPAETPEFKRAEELIRRRQATLSELDEHSREKSAHIREKLVKAIQANEKSIASSTVKGRDLILMNPAIVPEVALKLKVLFRINRVSNMFLSSVLNYFQSKAVFTLFVDEIELTAVLRHIAEKAPHWLSFVSNKNGIIVKINPELEMESVVADLKA